MQFIFAKKELKLKVIDSTSDLAKNWRTLSGADGASGPQHVGRSSLHSLSLQLI